MKLKIAIIENKHKNELNQFNKQINTSDEQYQILNNYGKTTNSNIDSEFFFHISYYVFQIENKTK